MRERILAFVDRLRAHDLAISPSETMDAVAAVGAAGVEREVLREALAATLVKDEHDRPAFDAVFEVAFPLVSGRAAGATKRRREASGGEPALGGRGHGGAGGRIPPVPERDREETPSRERREDGAPAARADGGRARAARRRALMRKPLHLLDPRDVEDAHDLVRALAPRIRGRLARRERRRRRGRLDVRRMLRAATATGGVPLRLLRSHRRPDRGDLLALVDLSGSVATASELCLGLVAPASGFFRRVHTFAYVDRLCPITIEGGHLTPDGPLDLHARSDFGQVLADLVANRALLTRRTLVLVVGDARNNRRPPRADLLRAIRERVQRLVWLVPEPRTRWNTGDSVLDRYAPACDAVLETETLGALLSGLRATL